MMRLTIRLLATVLAFSTVLVACGDDEPEPAAAPEPAEAPATTADPEPAPAEEAPEPAASEDPTSLHIAVIFGNTADDTWSTSMLGALNRVTAEAPYGLDITYEYFENISYAGRRTGSFARPRRPASST